MSKTERAIALILLGLILAIDAAILFPGLQAWFVADDFWHLAYVRLAHHPLDAYFQPYFGQMAFRPLTFTLNFIIGKLTGDSALAVHGADLFFQLVNVALVFALAQRLFRRAGELAAAAQPDAPPPRSPVAPALVAALVFAWHPITSLTAAWYCCRADLYGTGFSLATLLFALAATERTRGPWTPAIFLASLCALLCKENYLPLFLPVFALAYLFGGEAGRAARLKAAGRVAAPAVAAVSIYLVWRLLVLGGLGGYGTVSHDLIGLLAEAAYNVPRVVFAALRDFVVHPAPAGGWTFWPIVAGSILLVSIGGVGAVAREYRTAALGLALALASLAPAWNVAQMFAAREDRLLYFPLVGFALVAGALAAGPKRAWTRGLACAAALGFAAAHGGHAYSAVTRWAEEPVENLALSQAAAAYLEPHGPASPARRIYILGLRDDSYYLDMMVKLLLPSGFQDREFIPGDRPAFIWISKDSRSPAPTSGAAPAEVPPQRVSHATGPEMILETVTPPDLAAAAAADPGARVLEWDGLKLRDVTRELRDLHALRAMAREQIDDQGMPSFSFRKSPLELQWVPSLGLAVELPRYQGDPDRFIAADADPYLLSPAFRLPAAAAAAVEFELRLAPRRYLPPAESQGALAWESEDRPGFLPERSAAFTVIADGKFHRYRVELSSNIHWVRSTTVVRLRLDPISYPGEFELLSLRFLPEPSDEKD